MEYRENPMFGRRVFFLNPPLSIENVIAEELKAKEFEVYIIREYSLAKPVLRKCPNAICWIFIDDELSFDAWYNFIKSFEYDDELKSIFIGILTANAKQKDQENFLLNLKLPGGFVRIDQRTEEVCKQLEGILELNGAKGVRKYIRLNLEGNKDVVGYFSNGTNLFSFQLIDISPVGFAAVTPVNMAPMFKKDSFIRNVSITLGRYSFTCSIQIHHATIQGNKCLVVAILTDDTSKDIRKKIHDYIYTTLDRQYKIQCESMARDYTDYNIRPTIGGTEEEAVEEMVEEVTDEEGVEKTEAANATETTEKVESTDVAEKPVETSEQNTASSESVSDNT